MEVKNENESDNMEKIEKQSDPKVKNFINTSIVVLSALVSPS